MTSGPTPLEAALMCKYLYSLHENTTSPLIGGWSYEADNLITGGDGMVMGVFSRNDKAGNIEYALVNRGTVDWSLMYSDIYNNILQPFGMSNDMKASIKEAISFVEAHSEADITFVGHSKGGAEATANAVATKRDAIVFNPAMVNLLAYGLNAKDYTADMTAYIVEGEILNKIFGRVSEHIGTEEYLPSQYSDSVDDHSIDAVIFALLMMQVTVDVSFL